MDSTTLEFENARIAHAVYGGNESLLREMEERFNVSITARDGWIRVEGPGKEVESCKAAFAQLDQAVHKGIAVGRHEFRYAMDSVADTQTAASEGLESLISEGITCSRGRSRITPKTKGQRDYIRAVAQHDIVFGIGPAGTGKTYLAVALAVAALKNSLVERIVLTRPAVEAGEALGFLPGDLEEKISPYLRPLYDALNDMLERDEVQKLTARGTIEIAPLAYMRGRTLGNAFIILDEAQNTTTEQMFMFLTRMGPDSKCVVTGDQTQIDLPRHTKSGLIEAVDALTGVKGISIQVLRESDVVRHPLVQSIIAAYRMHRGRQESRL